MFDWCWPVIMKYLGMNETSSLLKCYLTCVSRKILGLMSRSLIQVIVMDIEDILPNFWTKASSQTWGPWNEGEVRFFEEGSSVQPGINSESSLRQFSEGYVAFYQGDCELRNGKFPDLEVNKYWSQILIPAVSKCHQNSHNQEWRLKKVKCSLGSGPFHSGCCGSEDPCRVIFLVPKCMWE